jgi:glycerate dehydrogenase
MMRGVFLDKDSVDHDDLDFAALDAALGHCRYFPETRPEQVAERIAEADVVITNKVVLSADHLARAPQLKLVCVAATGTNNVDVAAAAKAGIAVSNVRAYATQSVVEHVFAMVLSLIRHLPAYTRAVAEGRWSDSAHFCLLDFPITQLHGKRLGIVGYGELGQAVAHMARAFGLQVLVAQRPGGEPRPGRVALSELLSQVDILTLHCPLSENTRDLIDAAALAQMQPHSIVINTARGGIVNEPALAAALREGQIGGACVDVLSEEPPPADHPLLADDLPNLILTPHIAWASVQARQRCLDEVAANVEAFAANQARNRVD